MQAVRAAETPPSTRWSTFPVAGWVWAVLAIAVAAFGIRLPEFGNPIAGLDEQFYLLVGDRMWQGALPYVDIWDRKPAGLFLIYAAIRALPGDGVVAYQIVATLSLALTGMVAARITSDVLSPPAGLAAGLAILLYSVLFGAGFGEAPIFYDLLTIIAGACVLAVLEKPRDGPFDPRALAAMALCGVALTIKTSAVFESCCFGLLLVHQDWRRNSDRRALLLRAGGYLALGLGPMLALAGFYAWCGALDAFVFANFQSVFLRSGGGSPDTVARCSGLLLLLTPLILPGAAEWRHVPAIRRRVLGLWVIAAFLSFVAIGRCHEHYALPLVVPLALLASHALAGRKIAGLACAVLTLAIMQYAAQAGERTRRDEADFADLLSAIPADVRRGCLFVYEGPVMLYHKAAACLPGRYVFPGHFSEEAEIAALEQPSATILRQTLARRPAVIVATARPRDGGAPTLNDQILDAALRGSYRPVARRGIRLYGDTRIDQIIWSRMAL